MSSPLPVKDRQSWFCLWVRRLSDSEGRSFVPHFGFGELGRRFRNGSGASPLPLQNLGPCTCWSQVQARSQLSSWAPVGRNGSRPEDRLLPASLISALGLAPCRLVRLHNNKAKQTPAGEAYRSNLHNDVVQNRLTATSAAQLMKRSRVGPYPTCVRSIGEHSSQIPSSSSCSAATPSWPRRRSVICSQVR